MEQTEEMLRKDIVWVLWPRYELSAEEIHSTINDNFNRPWTKQEVETQLDKLALTGRVVKSSGSPATYSLRSPNV
jgi:predicted transcriptional regulator